MLAVMLNVWSGSSGSADRNRPARDNTKHNIINQHYLKERGPV